METRFTKYSWELHLTSVLPSSSGKRYIFKAESPHQTKCGKETSQNASFCGSTPCKEQEINPPTPDKLTQWLSSNKKVILSQTVWDFHKNRPLGHKLICQNITIFLKLLFQYVTPCIRHIGGIPFSLVASLWIFVCACIK